MDERRLASAASRTQDRLRDAIRGWKAELAAQGREFGRIDAAAYSSYATECVLRALAASPMAGCYALKGGNLFRIWDGATTSRPTLDLDMQRLDGGEDLDSFRAELVSLVGDAGFAEETGLVFDVASMRFDAIKEGMLGGAWRIEGDVVLGPPVSKGTRIHFVMEVTHGPAPRGALALQTFPSILRSGKPFPILASKPEWMAAEKLHSIVSRGGANTRLKDWWDIVRLRGRPGFDPAVLRDCVRHVFEVEFRGRHALPASADGVPGLTPAFATAEHEANWQQHRWPSLEGRDFSPGRDPALVEHVAATRSVLEGWGVFEPDAAALAARALADLAEAGRDLEGRGATPALARAFGAAFERLAASARDAAGNALAWRYSGEAALRALPRTGAASALAAAVGAAEAAGVLTPDAAAAAAAGLGGMLPDAPPVPAFLVGRADAAGASAARREARAVAAAPAATEERFLAALDRLSPSNRDSRNANYWMNSLANVLLGVRDGFRVPAGAEIADCPIPPEKAARIWASVARKPGLEPDLAAALGAARGAAPSRAP